MSEVVDSIVAELIARDNGYIATFDKATAAHGRFKASIDKLKVQTFDLGAEGQKYKAGVAGMAQAEEQGSARMVRAKKTVSDAAKVTAAAEKAAARAIADAQKSAQAARVADERASAKAAAAAQKDAEKKAAAAKLAADAVVAAAAREEAARARIAAMVETSLARSASSNTRGTGALFGSAVPREPSMIPPSVIPAAATGEVAEQAAGEAEINHLMADQATLQASLTVARGHDRDIIRDQITEMRLFNQLVRAGYTEEQATEQVEKRMLAIEAERAAIAQKQTGRQAGQFVAGAGLGRFGGLNAGTAGIATAALVAGGVAAIGASVNYAKQLESTAQALGLTTTQLQVYQRAAKDVNVTNEQLQSGFGQFASYLGRAQDGDKQAAKTFQALGINIKGVASAGDLLPTLIQRISQIPNAAQRAAVETRLFGEEGRRLDPLLSGGIDKVNSLATAMQAAGRVLSPQDISILQKAGSVLADVKQQLEVDVAKVVAGNATAIKSLANAFSDLLNQLRGVSRIVQDEGWLSEIFQHNNADIRAAANPDTYLKQVRIPALEAAQQRFNATDPTGPGRVEAAKDLANEIKLTNKAVADVKAARAPVQPAAQPGKPGDLSGLFKTGGKTADQLAAEADERTRRFQAQMGRLRDEQLTAQSQITSDEQARSAIAVEQINIDRKTQLAEAAAQADADIRRGADKGLTESRLTLQKQAINAVADGKVEVQAHHDIVSDIQRLAAIRSQQLDQADEALKTEEDQATTAADRARIEKELLANDIERQRITNQTVLDRARAGDGSITQQDIATAKGNLGDLGRKQSLGVKSIDAQNLGPGAQFLRDLPNTANQLNEAFQNVAVDGLKSMTDGLTDAITGVHSLGDAFRTISKQIIADLIRIAVEQAIVAPIAGALFGGGAATSLLSGIFGHRAAGGPVVAGRPYIVGEHRPEVFIPSVSGSIAPDARAAAPGGHPTIIQQSFTLDARYGITSSDLIEYVNQTARSAAARAGAASFQAGQSAMPAKLQKMQKLGN